MRILLLLLGFFICFNSVAAKQKAPSVSPYVYKKLSQVEKQIGKKAYSNARQELKKLLKNVDGYERAVVLRSLSSLYALQENYKEAANMLKQALALNALPPEQTLQARLNLAQLYMATGQYALAIKTLPKTSHLDASTAAMLANAYAQLKQYRKALPHIKRAIQQSKKPPQSWYQLNLALYYELDDYHSAARLLKKLMQLYPDNDEYWAQFASVLQQLKHYKKAASVQYLRYLSGRLKSEKEQLNLINLITYIGAPYKAGRLLQQGFNNGSIRQTAKNWETLANLWQMAKESDLAITALNKASSLSPKGKLYLQLAQIHVEQENWPKAIAAAQKALQKGGLRNAGQAYVLLGISQYEAGHRKAALKAFQRAAKYRKQKRVAQQWIDYLRSEKSL